MKGGDEVEIERVAGRLGAVRLARIAVAKGGKRDERVAALRSIPLVADGWAVLPDIAQLMLDQDGEVSRHAAECARQIAESLSRDRVEHDEIPLDVLRVAQAMLGAEASNATLTSSTRSSAVFAVAALREVTKMDEAAIPRLLGDADPSLRRAAAESLSPGPAAEAALENVLGTDSANEVAATAAAILCREVPAQAPALGRENNAERRAAKLGTKARDRLRALAADPSIPLADRLDLLPCLRLGAGGDAGVKDRQVLTQLAQSKSEPESLRKRAQALVSQH